MSIIKQKNRLERIDQILRQKNSGPSHEFASKIGISRTTLMDILDELRTIGFPIVYNHASKNYEYEYDGRLIFSFVYKNSSMDIAKF
jgi:biotin operon repressor